MLRNKLANLFDVFHIKLNSFYFDTSLPLLGNFTLISTNEEWLFYSNFENAKQRLISFRHVPCRSFFIKTDGKPRFLRKPAIQAVFLFFIILN